MEESQEEVQQSIGIYPTTQGIALEVRTGEDCQIIKMSPEDASTIAVNIISNIVLLQINASMRAAAEKAEIQQATDLLSKKGGLYNPYAT